MSRLNYRFICKWLILAIITAFLFNFICDRLVNKILSLSQWSILNTEMRETIITYEQSLIAWAESGQQAEKKRLFMEKAKNRNDLQLIGAHIFFRHGARTPLHPLSSLDQVILMVMTMIQWIFSHF